MRVEWSSTHGNWALHVEQLTTGDDVTLGGAIAPEELVIVITVI